MSDDARIEGLIKAVEVSPENHALRLVLAEALAESGRTKDALTQYGLLLEGDKVPKDDIVKVGRLALAEGDLQLAARLLERAKNLGALDGVAGLQSELERELGGPERRLVAADGEEHESRFVPRELLEPGPRTTFEDVGGLDDVKKRVHRAIILPFQRPDLYLKYGRSAGGGALLYGPPGCGKTLLARATAGECGLPFFNVRIEDVLDPYMGMSEQNLHDAFEHARLNAPCVLFIDELDAVAYARRKQAGSAGRPLVDQLLQELDAIGSDNRELLILAATNAPWDVDDALKRPGRLDRPMFVPPPDEKARRRILELMLTGRHVEGLDVKALAKSTPLFSGADLRALVEAGVDQVIDEALDSGEEPPLRMGHLTDALGRMRPTTLDWLASAANYVEFANQAGRYDELADFLKSREAKRLKDLADG
jgi:transitional endoplasmic reticulum ATPase